MSIPLDRLYHYIENVAEKEYSDSVNIYRFFPHGSKNIQDLNSLRNFPDYVSLMTKLPIYCNDQEPLAFDFYKQNTRLITNKLEFSSICKSLGIWRYPKNLDWGKNIFKKNILLHSEQRSPDVEKYIADDSLIPVYYWSHAIIARDWFRYGQHINFKKNISKQFLIYNRTWTGTREYRLKFSDMLIEHRLANHCLTFCNPIDNDQHYRDKVFINPTWQPQHKLEHYFPPSLARSCASADFDLEDYQSTEIEVVLETLFDDARLHLTEKSLRPIACQQPFILVATHGSLQYLKNYGFKTFDSVWDETYDNIQDPYQRMLAIIEVMRDISSWSTQKRDKNFVQLQQIAKFNHNYFFSDQFQLLIISELQQNLTCAVEQIKTNPGFERWLSWWEKNMSHPKIQEFFNSNHDESLPTRKGYQQVLSFIENYSKN